MNLLILTQKVDKKDPVLGFFHEWIIEFAKRCNKVIVIALEVDTYDFPHNVKVLSLGKEKGNSRLQIAQRFLFYIWKLRSEYTHVFVHMNQIYIVLGGALWRLLGKKIALWYVHKKVSVSLRIAALLAHDIFTAAKESFRIPSNKIHVVGHGVVINDFLSIQPRKIKYKISSVGRITPIKNLDTLLEAVALCREEGCLITCDIIGPILSEKDQLYFKQLQKIIEERELKEVVLFHGGLVPSEVKKYFEESDISVNLTPTGGIDKVVLESILAGAVPLTSNTAFAPLFGKYNNELIFEYRNAQDLALKIQSLYANSTIHTIQHDLEEKVKRDYDLSSLIQKIVELMAG